MSKAVVVGDLNVGKTCLINRYMSLNTDREVNNIIIVFNVYYVASLSRGFWIINQDGLLLQIL